jgi:hypothetical protein
MLFLAGFVRDTLHYLLFWLFLDGKERGPGNSGSFTPVTSGSTRFSGWFSPLLTGSHAVLVCGDYLTPSGPSDLTYDCGSPNAPCRTACLYATNRIIT